ncbi:hypothetical protein AT05_03330 [Schleiferia thermophila str. Yellowstone]|nr:hypothetical protein AT05_03330 [Schleiferia thermophila str. Yellowstone]
MVRKTLLLLTLSTSFALLSCERDDFDINDPRLNYTGTWDVKETEGDFAPQSYTVTIDLGELANNLIIRGLYAQGPNFTTTALVSGRSLDIPVQTRTGLTLSGSGTANQNYTEISLQFSVNDGSSTDNVKAELKKR